MSQPAVSTHPDFNAADADVVVQSADGVQFRLHRKYLGANTGAFLGPDHTAVVSNASGGDEDVVHLTEPANVLEILFGYIYPRRHPVLDDVKFQLLWPFAEAAGKYEVFSALDICSLHLRRFIATNGAKVFGYAIRHDYKELMNETALYLIGNDAPMATVVENLPGHAIMAWMKYVDSWKSVIDDMTSLSSLELANSASGQKFCKSCRDKRGKFLGKKIAIDYELKQSLHDARAAYAFHVCDSCSGYNWLLRNHLTWDDEPRRGKRFTDCLPEVTKE